jgi:penicillin G amidase
MRRLAHLVFLGVVVAAAALVGCGDNDAPSGPDGPLPDGRPPPPSGPYDGVALKRDIVAGVTQPVHTVRDRHGIMHIRAENVRDLGYAQGYVMAHDRLPQMDILRRFGDGTLAELFGVVDQGSIETDLQMRAHLMRPLAERAWSELKASSSAEDRGIVDLLEGFAAGVNAANKDFNEGVLEKDPAIVWYSPATFREWTPIDSLVLGRFQSFSLSFTVPLEITLTQIYQAARARFDGAPADAAARFARRGISADLMTVKPLGRDPTINGFPNVGADSGTRSDAGRPTTAGQGALDKSKAAAIAKAAVRKGKGATASRAPEVPQDLLTNARQFFRPTLPQGPHAFMVPHAGSNNWVVGPSLAGGKALLAGDQHLSLPNPSIFYPVHLTVPGEIDVFGQTFPGIPGVILGSNGKAAWTSTVVFHDVNDVYLETIAPCTTEAGDCVMHNGAQVPIEKRTEQVRVGLFGNLVADRTVSATYERVPHHGPIVPTISGGMIVPRTASTALSIRYTGYEPTHEIRAVWKLAHSRTVDEGFKALADFSFGGQNWVLIDDQKNIGWTTNAKVPRRKPAAYGWDPDSNPGGMAPFFILPGTGEGDWESVDPYVSTRYVPHAINPAAGFLATANSDPVGTSFDGNPLNGPQVDGRPLYVGVTYAAGVRTERITEKLRAAAAAGTVTLEQLGAIQHDRRSNVGFHLRAPVLAALAFVADPSGAPPGVADYLAGLTQAQRDRLVDARSRLAAWTLDTPTGLGAQATATEKADAVATTIWNMFMHYFFELTLQDEFADMGQDVWGLDDNFLARIAMGLLVEPAGFVQSAHTQQPILCDSMSGADEATPDQSCTQKVIEATLAALVQLDGKMASTDPATWLWGKLHTLTLKPLFPVGDLELPAPGTPMAMAGGYPKPGDQFAVNRADCGWANKDDFTQDGDGPAQRFLAETMGPGVPIRMRLEHPGGVVFDRRSKYYSNLLEQSYLPEQHFDVPFVTTDIVTAGEERWVFRQ